VLSVLHPIKNKPLSRAVSQSPQSAQNLMHCRDSLNHCKEKPFVILLQRLHHFPFPKGQTYWKNELKIVTQELVKGIDNSLPWQLPYEPPENINQMGL
jgi:hypothetical protein